MKSLIIIFTLLAVIVCSVNADFLEDASIPFTRIDSSVEIPDYPIAKPLKGGKLRVLIIGPQDVTGLMSIGIAARLDCTFKTILTDSRSTIGIQPEPFSLEAVALSQETIEKNAGVLFREQWDVLWLDFDFNALSVGFQQNIINHIEKGTGFIYVGDRKDLVKLKPRGKKDNTQLKAAAFGKFEPEFIGKRKRGVLVTLPPLNPYIGLRERSNYLTSAVNAIMFSTGRYDTFTITKLPKFDKTIEQESIDIMNFRISLFNKSDTKPIKIFSRFRNERNEIVSESQSSYKVEKGRSFVIIEYPFLSVGDYSIDITAADSDGVIAVAGTSFSVSAMKYLIGLEFPEVSSPEEGLMIGQVKCSTPYTEAMQVRVDFLDSRRRLIGRNDLVPDINKVYAEFAAKLENLHERVIIVRASLFQSNRLVNTIEKPVFIRKQYDPRKFTLIVSDDRPLDSTSNRRYEVFRNAGISHVCIDVAAISDLHNIYTVVSDAASNNLGVIPRITRIASTVPGDTMDPVITEYDFNEQLKQRTLDIVDTLRTISPLAYSLGKDNMLTGFETDVSFSETDIESFRFFLDEGKYETVEALNSAWKTSFSSFEEAQPVKYDEAERSGMFVRWLDTRQHMEEVFTQVHYEASDNITFTESGALVGIEGYENTWSPFRGYNIFEMTGFLSMSVSQQDAGPGFPGDVAVSSALASFSKMGSLLGLSVGGEAYRRGNEVLLRAAPWQSLFMEMNSIWWQKAYGNAEAALTPQLTLSPAFSVVAEESREIMDGIDLLLLGSERLIDTIGLLYSPVSKMAARTSAVSTKGGRDNNGQPPEALLPETSVDALSNSVRSMFLACQDAGYTPMFVADDQLTGDWLTDNKFTVLLLPYVQAMSDVTVQCIETFVNNGGTVIADMRTGVMDEYLIMRGQGALDSMFGIFQKAERKAVRKLGKLVPNEIEGGIPSGITLENCPVDPSVSVREGVYTLADIDGSPAVIVNRHGRGTAVFLNVGMDYYEHMRLKGQEEGLRDILSWCLYTGGAGLPYCSVRDTTGTVARKVSTTVFRDEVIEYIGIMPDPLAQPGEYSGSDFVLDLTETGKNHFVYNIRGKKFLGVNTRVPLDISPGKAGLFALVPYQVKELELKLKRPVVRTGNTIDYTVTLIPRDIKVVPGRHVFHVEVLGADGSVMPYFTGNHEAEKGVLNASVTIGPNDAPGRWSLQVTDVITGKKAERAFMVMAMGSSIIE